MDVEDINLSNLNDEQIGERMRQCNNEKFKSLVRMHLSFELDLNTDEFDLPCHEIVYEDKGKLKKWNRMSKKHKGNTPSSKGGSGSANNSPTETLQQQIDAGFMLHLHELKDFLLLEKNITQEGIFRKTGSVLRQNDLRNKIQNDKPLNLLASCFTAHDCATVFKGYLAELPEPLLTDAHYPAHMQIAPLCLATSTDTANNKLERLKREEHLLNAVQLLLHLLPADNRSLLQHIIEMLHAVAEYAHVNKMTANNLATLFAPHLVCPRNLPPEALHYVAKKMSSFIAYMILQGNAIFELPAKLSTDIRAYFMERKRKKTMSPEQTLDESISDVSTVNTVYTFVDREKTAAAHHANNTDTELAQLYAFIQTMPESNRKRRLIKQFNKQNGQGTPLQFVNSNRVKHSENNNKSAKSIGDSIKKHILNNCKLSRTPKQQHNNNNTIKDGIGMETPNMSSLKKPKQRVLFQSPTLSYHKTRDISNMASSSVNLASVGCHTPSYNLKTHPLQKSISSSSLLSNSKSATNTPATKTLAQHGERLELCANCSPKQPVSAPVSRQTSDGGTGVGEHHTSNMIADAAKQIIDKKTVVWDEDRLLEIVDISKPCTPCSTEISPNELKSRYKSEPNLSCYAINEKPTSSIPHSSCSNATKNSATISLTRKLIKGVSMSNLKFPFSTPESTKRLVRTVSSQLKRRSSDDAHTCTEEAEIEEEVPLLEHDDNANDNAGVVNDLDVEDLDDETFEDNSEDQLDSDVDDEHEEMSDIENKIIEENDYDVDVVDNTNAAGLLLFKGSGSGNCRRQSGCYRHLLLQHQNNLQRNLEHVTSTPSMLLGRRSMSPITKSTQRMPKAMQESIMTPRSRKPVMVLPNALGGSSSSDQNQTAYQTDLSSFREQDEEESLSSSSTEKESFSSLNTLKTEDDAIGKVSGPAIFKAAYSKATTTHHEFLDARAKLRHRTAELATPITNTVMLSANMEEKPILQTVVQESDELSSHFKEYLLSRSVLTGSPVDSSFSSQPDDFNTGTAQDIEDFDTTQLNPSLLYCLDGNLPECDVIENDKIKENSPNWSNFNKARKRAATAVAINNHNNSNQLLNSSSSSEDNKENQKLDDSDSYMLSKKLLITEYPGETSF